MEEAFNLLGKPLPAAEAVRKAHEWPPVAFSLGYGRRCVVAIKPPRGERDIARSYQDGRPEPVVAFEV